MKTQQPTEVLEVDRWVPNYRTPCQNCGCLPTVTAEKNGEVVYDSQMCGPCTWGESETIDPENW